MMQSDPELLRAQSRAKKLLDSLGIENPGEVDLRDIAMHLNVEVVEGPLKGSEARLVRKGPKGLIRIRDDIPEIGRWRFAVGHEIGHWCLHETHSQLHTCLSGDVHGYAGSNEELESNAFAAALLMPKALVRERFGRRQRTFTLIEEAAQEMQTTFTATAVRMIETSQYPCLVVFSAGRQVKWWRGSPTAQSVWLERRQQIDRDTVAWAAWEGAKTGRRPESVPAEAWFGHLSHCDRLEIQEQSIMLGAYGTVVTIIFYQERDEGW